jgi:hypothetical protein
LNRNFVDLFKEIAKKENVLEAIRKYGGIAVRENEPGKSSVICRSCFLLVKGINDRVRKFSSLCQNNDNTRKTTSYATAPSSGKRTFLQQQSPASKAASPSLKLNKPKRIRPFTSPSASTSHTSRTYDIPPQSATNGILTGSLLSRFSATTTQSDDESAKRSAKKAIETRSHMILKSAGLRTTTEVNLV